MWKVIIFVSLKFSHEREDFNNLLCIFRVLITTVSFCWLKSFLRFVVSFILRKVKKMRHQESWNFAWVNFKLNKTYITEFSFLLSVESNIFRRCRLRYAHHHGNVNNRENICKWRFYFCRLEKFLMFIKKEYFLSNSRYLQEVSNLLTTSPELSLKIRKWGNFSFYNHQAPANKMSKQPNELESKDFSKQERKTFLLLLFQVFSVFLCLLLYEKCRWE